MAINFSQYLSNGMHPHQPVSVNAMWRVFLTAHSLQEKAETLSGWKQTFVRVLVRPFLSIGTSGVLLIAAIESIVRSSFRLVCRLALYCFPQSSFWQKHHLKCITAQTHICTSLFTSRVRTLLLDGHRTIPVMLRLHEPYSVSVRQNTTTAECGRGSSEILRYQQQLKEVIKTSVREILSDPVLYGCLAHDGQSGRELLQAQDLPTMRKIAFYAQYKELLEEIRCPASIEAVCTGLTDGGALLDRLSRLTQLRTIVLALPDEERRQLVRSLLNASFTDNAALIATHIPPLSWDMSCGPLGKRWIVDETPCIAKTSTATLLDQACQEVLAEN
jgi:hypothetical protein